MIRKAFVMSVNRVAEVEYARRHNPIWPELEAVLRAHGVETYSIFLHLETRQLFAYVEFSSQAQWDTIWSSELQFVDPCLVLACVGQVRPSSQRYRRLQH